MICSVVWSGGWVYLVWILYWCVCLRFFAGVGLLDGGFVFGCVVYC